VWLEVGVDKKNMEDKSRQNTVSGIHKQHSKFLPLREEHIHGYDHGHGGAGNGDVLVAPYPRDSHSSGEEVGQEEGRGSRIACAHPHS
jgi:hypothetical protein